MQQALALLARGDAPSARAALRSAISADRAKADLHHLLGAVEQSLGNAGAAEEAYRRAVGLAPDEPSYSGALGHLLEKKGDLPGAERYYRKALEGDAGSAEAAMGLARVLLMAARPDEAARILHGFAAEAEVAPELLMLYAAVARGAGRHRDAAAALARVLHPPPLAARAALELADLEVEMGAVPSALRRLGEAPSGGEPPLAVLVRARAARADGLLEEAQGQYGKLSEVPGLAAIAAREKAELTWMHSGSLEAALVELEKAGAKLPPLQHRLIRIRLLEAAGRLTEAMAEAENGGGDASLPLLLAQVRVALALDKVDYALARAEAALSRAPTHRDAILACCEARIAAGRFVEAEALASANLGHGRDQRRMALLTTCWRLLRDPRYGQYCNYEKLVGEYHPGPFGPGREAWLADLGSSLRALHELKAHPLEQSVRGGSQTSNHLHLLETPEILRDFFRAAAESIDQFASKLGGGRWHIAGSWSVLLRSTGFHVSHVHPQGWLSTAFYVDFPPPSPGTHEGWLEFGRPGVRTPRPLEPERLVEPEPGKLVIFPSYFWHGTVPFSGAGERLTISFDVARESQI